MGSRRRQSRDLGKDGRGACAPPPAVGGRFRPLSTADSEAIRCAALDILARIGMAEVPDWLSSALIGGGARRRDDGRMVFPRRCVEAAVERAARTVALPGFVEDRGLEIGGGRVHIGTGGAAVQVLDAATEVFRDSTLADLYGLMRVLDHCP
ncbi:trimethylamine methyltransferase family protein, partial [Pelagibius sp.]|uniref:trimethylamine methyltransferase family protein n=1 Tax=Pelagibius sp. TaxID=1931238 RepID=UPI00261FE934